MKGPSSCLLAKEILPWDGGWWGASTGLLGKAALALGGGYSGDPRLLPDSGFPGISKHLPKLHCPAVGMGKQSSGSCLPASLSG